MSNALNQNVAFKEGSIFTVNKSGDIKLKVD